MGLLDNTKGQRNPTMYGGVTGLFPGVGASSLEEDPNQQLKTYSPSTNFSDSLAVQKLTQEPPLQKGLVLGPDMLKDKFDSSEYGRLVNTRDALRNAVEGGNKGGAIEQQLFQVEQKLQQYSSQSPEDIAALKEKTKADIAARDAAAAAATLKDKKAKPTTTDVHTVVEATVADAKKKGVDPATFTPQKPDNVEQGYWDKLTSQFDLTTVGISLLATNGNGKPLSANLGLALAAGKDAITKEEALQTATDKDARKEARADRELDIKALQQRAQENYYKTLGASAGSKAQTDAVKDRIAINKQRIELANAALGYKNAKAKPSLTTATNSQQYLLNAYGADSLKDIDVERKETFKGFTQDHANYSQFVTNAAEKVGMPELATNSHLRNLVVDKIIMQTNPLYQDMFEGAGVSTNPKLSATVNGLMQTENYRTLLQALSAG